MSRSRSNFSPARRRISPAESAQPRIPRAQVETAKHVFAIGGERCPRRGFRRDAVEQEVDLILQIALVCLQTMQDPHARWSSAIRASARDDLALPIRLVRLTAEQRGHIVRVQFVIKNAQTALVSDPPCLLSKLIRRQIPYLSRSHDYAVKFRLPYRTRRLQRAKPERTASISSPEEALGRLSSRQEASRHLLRERQFRLQWRRSCPGRRGR